MQDSFARTRSMKRAFRTRPRDSIRSKKIRLGSSGLTPTWRLKSTIVRTLPTEAGMGSTALDNSDMKRSAGVDGGGRR